MLSICKRAALLLAVLTALGLTSCTLLHSPPPADDTIGPAATRAYQHLAGEVEATPTTTAPDLPAAGPLTLTVHEAILVALEHNQAFSIQRLGPSIRRTAEQEARAAFDPLLSAEVSAARDRERLIDRSHETTGDYKAEAAISQLLPTGTEVSAGVTADRLTSSLQNDQYVTRLGVTVNQALLRDGGLGVNLAAIRQARLDTLASEYELRGLAEALVAQAEETYWDYVLAERIIEVVAKSLALADRQVREVQDRIAAEKLAKREIAAALAERARRQQSLIDARSDLATIRLRLLRLLNPRHEGLWAIQLTPATPPAVPSVKLDDVDTYVQVAMRMRADLNQARLALRRNELDLVRTRNGLLPRLDLFITLGRSGYAGSFGDSLAHITEETDYDLLAGLRAEYPAGNRAAQARHQRAVYTREQAAQAIENVAQLVQVDVRSAYVEVQRAAEQVKASAVTRQFQEETLNAENEKFREGRSTNLLVAQAQRDLLEAQIGEVRAAVNHLKALVQLHLQQGVLLERRGLAAPGGKPVDVSPLTK